LFLAQKKTGLVGPVSNSVALGCGYIGNAARAGGDRAIGPIVAGLAAPLSASLITLEKRETEMLIVLK
jgi:hypothetical protein